MRQPAACNQPVRACEETIQLSPRVFKPESMSNIRGVTPAGVDALANALLDALGGGEKDATCSHREGSYRWPTRVRLSVVGRVCSVELDLCFKV